jgi:uncharacterized protein (DUF952 family)
LGLSFGLYLSFHSKEAFDQAIDEEYLRVRSLSSEGFIHCSTLEQVVRIANGMFAGANDLLLLRLNTEMLNSRIVYENLEGGDQQFPHVYGPIERDAIEVFPFKWDGETFVLPEFS